MQTLPLFYGLVVALFDGHDVKRVGVVSVKQSVVSIVPDNLVPIVKVVSIVGLPVFVQLSILPVCLFINWDLLVVFY